MNLKEMKLAEKLSNADYHNYEFSDLLLPEEEEEQDEEQEQKDGGN